MASAAPLLVAIVFSKDRALQLDATLRSLDRTARARGGADLAVRVLWKCSDERQRRRYARVAAEHPWAAFHEEAGFQRTLLTLVEGAEHLLFVVDDALFVREWDPGLAVSLLRRHGEALGFSLRLGRNTTSCYALDRPQQIPPMLPVGPDAVAFEWPRAEADFGYPLELSSSIYRASDVVPLLRELSYRNPNDLEDQLSRRAVAFAASRPVLLSAERSIAFCAPVNVVQEFCANRAGHRRDLSPAALADAFDAGRRVRTDAFLGFVPRACHEEVDLPLTRPDAMGRREPLVSVVIPCYRQAGFLPQAVASVALQTFTDWELVIVDDGSPDDTASVARALVDALPGRRLSVLTQENAGVAVARNRGIQASHGEYVLPLDADDLLDPAFLERTVAALDAHPEADIACTDGFAFGARREPLVIRGPFAVERLREANGLNYCSLYRRRMFDRVGGYNPNMALGYEDWDFWISCAEQGSRAVHVAEPLFLYRVKKESRETGAQRHHRELVARIVLNHPALYSAGERAAAARLLGEGRHARREVRGAASLHGTERRGAPAVSVIIPCHRQAEYLPQAVASVVQQTFTDWEIVVVDDGSPDATAATVHELAAALPGRRVRLVRQENQGLAVARNAGIGAAHGRYVLPLDADDLLDPAFLERCLAALAADARASIAFTDVLLFEGRSERWHMGPFDLHKLRERNVLTCTSLHRREVWEAVGGYDPNMFPGYEDWNYWIAAAKRGFTAVHVEEPLFFYRVKPGSMVTKALAHHDQLKARMILNHPELFDAAARANAERLLRERPLPTRQGARVSAVARQPHDGPARAQRLVS